jgi:curved DNA-binding protein CbpA
VATRRIPDDDLYARLRVPIDAPPEAIEVAWRSLLKRHHPDVAGEPGLEATKRINVAHEWLADPELRATYDQVRHPRRSSAARARTWGPPRRDPRPAPEPQPVRRAAWPADPETMLARFLDRLGRLTPDELDRLSLAEPNAIAFASSLRRILPAERRNALADAHRRVRERLAPAAWSRLPIRDAVLAVALELTVGPFLDAEVPDPARARIRERLLRGWEAAIDQPRYGPNTPAVERVRRRAARLSPSESLALVAAAGPAARPGIPLPWPFGESPADDEALRVSAALAARDLAVAPRLDRIGRVTRARARRTLGRVGHAVALRHGFSAAEYADLVGPWRAATGDPATGRSEDERPTPTVRRSA